MEKTLVMTVIGKDRTGLVRSLARLIEDCGGNWLESRMCRLGGEFAGILRASVPHEKEQELVLALEGLNSEALSVIIHQDEAVPFPASARTATLNVVGHDRPGIVHQISTALAHQKINVEELETECSSAPMSGERIFNAVARLRIPESCNLTELRREMEEVGSELMVDISFTGM